MNVRHVSIAYLFMLVGAICATKDNQVAGGEIIARSREVKEVKDRYTVGKFAQQFNKDQLFVLSIVLTSYIALTFPPCNLVLNQDNVEFNQAAKNFNAEMKRLSLKTENNNFYESRIELRNEYECESQALTALKWSASALTLVCLCHYNLDQELSDFFSKKNLQRSCLATVTLYAMYHTMFFVSSQFEEGSPYGIGCMAGLYAALCCGYNVYKMRSVH